MKYLSILLLFLLVACPQTQDEPQEVAVEKAEEEDMSNIHTEEVSYSANGLTLKGYLAYDKNIEGKRPGVIIVHEWWGHNEYARKRAEMLAQLGYTGFAIDMYGEGKNTTHPEDANKFMTAVFDNMSDGEARFNAALELLKNHPTVDSEKVAAIGYCFGGAIVLHMARVGTDLDGVVSFHGVLSSMHKPEPGSVKANILVAHGGSDQMVPMEQVEAFKKEMDEANADYKVIVYENASHSFTNPAADNYKESLPLAYNEEADKKSWEDMKNFLNTVLSN